MQKRRIIVASLVILFMLAIIAGYMLFSYNKIKPDDDRICDGIKVDTVDISGMTKAEADQAVDSYVEQKKSRTIQIDVDGKIVTTSIGEIGYMFSAGDFVQRALKVGKGGNMVQNYKELQEAAQGKISYSVESQIDEKVLKKFVKKKCKKLCTEAKNSNIKMQSGEFVYTKAQTGVSLDVDETVQMIKTAVEEAEDNLPIKVMANMKVEQPKVTQETAAKCKDKIGTFSTTFNASNANRSKNLTNAARLINGSVIYPGETFSVHDAISPLTEENGYYAAASYNNGKVEDSLGGGVCQVSTTLYNSILKAELEIVERSPHSMVVSYVKPSMDAAIAGDYKDLKFKNNTKVPVYIQGGTYGGTIYFNLYGEETRSSDRKVTFESEVTQTIEPGADKVTLDKTKPESFFEITQEAHTGYRANLWKIVTENGEQTRKQVNSSAYSASPRYVTKGSMKEPKETPKPAATRKPQNKSNKNPDRSDRRNNETNNNNSGTNPATAQPTPSPAADNSMQGAEEGSQVQ